MIFGCSMIERKRISSYSILDNGNILLLFHPVVKSVDRYSYDIKLVEKKKREKEF